MGLSVEVFSTVNTEYEVSFSYCNRQIFRNKK